RLRRLRQRVDGLAGTIFSRLWHPVARGLPQLADRVLFPDDHARGRRRRSVGEDAAGVPGRNEVRSDVAERTEPAVVAFDSVEAAEAAPGDVFEEHPLDRLARAELEHLLLRR